MADSESGRYGIHCPSDEMYATMLLVLNASKGKFIPNVSAKCKFRINGQFSLVTNNGNSEIVQ